MSGGKKTFVLNRQGMLVPREELQSRVLKSSKVEVHSYPSPGAKSQPKRTRNAQQKSFLEEPLPQDIGADWSPKVRTNGNLELRFGPGAWAKLQYFKDNKNGVEVSGFAISHKDDPLCVVDFQLIKQESQVAFTDMDDEAIADFTDDMIDRGLRPEQFSRIWVHTHPGTSATPSGHDEKTFRESFGEFNWAIMCIIAKGAQTARLKIKTPFLICQQIPVVVDFSIPILPIDYDDLKEEFIEKVKPRKWSSDNFKGSIGSLYDGDSYGYDYRGRYARNELLGLLNDRDVDNRLTNSQGRIPDKKWTDDWQAQPTSKTQPGLIILNEEDTEDTLDLIECGWCGHSTVASSLIEGVCKSCRIYTNEAYGGLQDSLSAQGSDATEDSTVDTASKPGEGDVG